MPNYPYTSGQAALTQAFTQLRKGFPAKVDAGYLQRFSIAPANESYIISILRFLRLIDDEGNRVEARTDYFFGGDDVFKRGLEGTLRGVYSQLFDEMGDEALDVQREDLVNWFRAADKTSALVGQRQANTFRTLAALAGHGELPAVRPVGTKKGATGTGTIAKKAAANKATPKLQETKAASSGRTGDVSIGSGGKPRDVQDVGLTVRIEVNLPPGGDADTYDAIFASIKKHLMS